MQNNFLDSIITFCKNEFYTNNYCPLGYTTFINYHCEKCLENDHFRSIEPAYQCKKAPYVYVCKYANKYASEIFLLLKVLFNNIPNKSPHILSFGAGPATELFALKQLLLDGVIDCYHYTGVDNNSNWQPVWDIITVSRSKPEQFLFQNIFAEEFINNYVPHSNDIILFHYMLSDFVRYATKKPVIKFLQALLNRFIIFREFPILLFNDLHLNFSNDDRKCAIDVFLNTFLPYYNIKFNKFFRNNKHNEEQKYRYVGSTPWNKNDLIFDLSEDTLDFNPYETMSAIQIILKGK